MNVGQKIKEIRREKGLTQRDLAKEINKSESTLKKYENGEVAITVDVLLDVAEVLNVNPTKLLSIEDIDIIKLIKKSYSIDTDNELIEYDINTYMEFLRYKYSN